MKRLLDLLLFAILMGGLGATSQAGSDHERAREAVQQGEILPLVQILKRVRAEFEGEMLEVELEEDRDDRVDGRLAYEVKLLAADGAVMELYYDARTGELLKARGHGLEDHERGQGGHDEDDEDDDLDWFWD